MNRDDLFNIINTLTQDNQAESNEDEIIDDFVEINGSLNPPVVTQNDPNNNEGNEIKIESRNLIISFSKFTIIY